MDELDYDGDSEEEQLDCIVRPAPIASRYSNGNSRSSSNSSYTNQLRKGISRANYKARDNSSGLMKSSSKLLRNQPYEDDIDDEQEEEEEKEEGVSGRGTPSVDDNGDELEDSENDTANLQEEEGGNGQENTDLNSSSANLFSSPQPSAAMTATLTKNNPFKVCMCRLCTAQGIDI